jgi:hypothetical protein
MRYFGTALLLVLVAGIQAETRKATLQDIKEYVAKAIKDDDVKLRPPSFDTDGVNLQYDLGGVVVADPVKTNPIDLVLEQQFRVAAIQSDKNEISKKWLAPKLGEVEKIITRMVEDLEIKEIGKDQLLRNVKKNGEKIAQIYGDALDEAARQLGKKEATSKRPAKVYYVNLSTTPENGAIKCMPAGRWDIYQFLTRVKKLNVPEPEWTAIVQSKNIPLVGKYRFRVTWSNGGKQFDDIVEVTSNEPLTFRQP